MTIKHASLKYPRLFRIFAFHILLSFFLLDKYEIGWTLYIFKVNSTRCNY